MDQSDKDGRALQGPGDSAPEPPVARLGPPPPPPPPLTRAPEVDAGPQEGPHTPPAPPGPEDGLQVPPSPPSPELDADYDPLYIPVPLDESDDVLDGTEAHEEPAALDEETTAELETVAEDAVSAEAEEDDSESDAGEEPSAEGDSTEPQSAVGEEEPTELAGEEVVTAISEDSSDELDESTTESDSSAAEPAATTGDVVAEERHKMGIGKKVAIVLAALLGVAILGAAGIAYAGYDYAKKYDGKILPGATVAGVDIGGMTPDDAVKAVRQAVRPQLFRKIEISWNDKSWSVSPKKLGAMSNARAVVDEALAASADASFLDKTRMRVLGDDLAFERDVAISYPARGARGFIQGLASTLHRDPRDASMDYSTGWVKIIASRTGRDVDVPASLNSLRSALLTGGSFAQLTIDVAEPAVTEDAFEKVILVRIGENKVYLYEDGKITHEYLVATGQPAYPTPTGEFEIIEKRYMPTWVNPAPDGWGKDMPASIPPGISNPLGLRALNWSADGIRFHGTTATYSLGYNASHGCVRMSNDAVIEFYDLVDVGTPIISLQSSAYDPIYDSADDSEPTAENSADSAGTDERKTDG
jgi:hypothetical protein